MRTRLCQLFYRVAAVKASFPKLLVVPRIFANCDSGDISVKRQRKLFGGRLEITRFVENIVAWKQHFVLTKHNASALQHGGAVVDRVAGRITRACDGSADDGEIQVGGVGRKLRKMLLCAIQETLLFEQIARRISNKRQFGECHNVRTGFSRSAHERKYALSVTAKITDSGIGLCQRDLHAVNTIVAGLGGRGQSSRCPNFCFFVRKYAAVDSCAGTMQGIRSTTCMPARSSALILSGLLDSSRSCLTLKYCRISAGIS